MPEQQTVHVDLGLRSYDISIGHGNLDEAGLRAVEWLQSESPKCFIVSDTNVLQPHANAVKASLQTAGAEVRVVCVNPGESSKSIAEASDLYDELVDFKADRRTAVVAVGGGVVGDLAGSPK